MKLIELIRIAGFLKLEKRKGWIQKGLQHQIESVADHSFRTAIITLFLEDYWKEKGLDHEKMLKMALIHDLPEGIIGDITPRDNIQDKQEREINAMNEIIQLTDHFKQLKDIWKEFIEQESKEAKIITQIDKLEMAIQALEYGCQKNPDLRSEFFLSVKGKITEPKLKDIFNNLEKRIN
ncbi:MAG: HD domain-containing protein [Candidatus Helarchaeota archaeon]